MYKADVCKSLKLRIQERVNSQLNDDFTDQLISALKDIENCHEFHLGEQSEDLAHHFKKFQVPGAKKRLFQGEFGDVRLPYKVCLFTYEHAQGKYEVDEMEKSQYMSKSSRTAILVRDFGRPDILQIETLQGGRNNKSWILFPFVRLYSVDKPILKTDALAGKSYSSFDDEALNNNTAYYSTASTEVKETLLNSESVRKVLLTASVVVNLALKLLSCKNSVTKTVYKNNKRTIKKGKKVRLYEYHLIGFSDKKQKVRYVYHPAESKKKGSRPFGWTMGHWKTYTEDAPLFGKIIGTWWWADVLKGSKQEGFISKDYKLKN